MNARNGKIARLPREIRLELNERLERSEESPQLLQWLNALPEVQKVVQDSFAGVPISKQNLSEWRQGGFEEWLARRNLCEDAHDLSLLAEEMDDDSQRVLADDAATVLAARFGSLIANWNGEVDEKFEAKSRVLNRLCRSVVQLQRGTHRARQENFDLTVKQEARVKAEDEELKHTLLKPIYDTLKLPAMAKVYGGGTKGQKIAEFIMAIQRGELDADLDVLPSDKFEDEEAPANPLEESEIEDEEEEDSTHPQSESVKLGQTDLPQSNAALVSTPSLDPIRVNPRPSAVQPAATKPETSPIIPIGPHFFLDSERGSFQPAL
jgi:hypothetical protein